MSVSAKKPGDQEKSENDYSEADDDLKTGDDLETGDDEEINDDQNKLHITFGTKNVKLNKYCEIEQRLGKIYPRKLLLL